MRCFRGNEEAIGLIWKIVFPIIIMIRALRSGSVALLSIENNDETEEYAGIFCADWLRHHPANSSLLSSAVVAHRTEVERRKFERGNHDAAITSTKITPEAMRKTIIKKKKNIQNYLRATDPIAETTMSLSMITNVR